ncbi:MAG: CPBP family intramembrane glutamic endopeptidase [Isosphaeraceae bacterium]|nr:CPBP family intramembrane glutamic endopeptidase [Isosphaeraceae bacterium]
MSPRRIAPGALFLALGVHVAASLWANFVLFRSRTLLGIARGTGGLIDGTLVANALLLALVVGVCLVGIGGARLRELGFRPRTLGRGLLAILAAWVGVVLLARGLAALSGAAAAPAMRRVNPGMLLGQVFGNVPYEEILFRGVLPAQLALSLPKRGDRPRWGLGLLVSQVVFALIHVPNRLAFDAWTSISAAVSDLGALFVIGLILSFVALRTRNLFIAMGIHLFLNTAELLIPAPGWSIYAAIVVAAIGFLAWGPISGEPREPE